MGPAQRSLGHSTLQNANDPAGKAEPFGHHRDHVCEQRLVHGGMAYLDASERVGIEDIENARHLGLDGGTTRPPGDETHLTDRGVRPEAAHAYDAFVAHVDNDANAAFE